MTLNLVAANRKEPLKENVSYLIDEKLGVLKTVGIFGANASGKSNVLKALEALRKMVLSSSNWKLDEKIPCYEPFRFDDESKGSPSTFELEFFGPDDLRYIYTVTYGSQEIEFESLEFFPSTQKASLFKRFKANDGSLEFKAGNHLKGKVRTIPCLKNNLYLSKAANTEGAPEVIKDIYRFFMNKINVMLPHQGITVGSFLKDDAYRKMLAGFLACADTGISHVGLKEQKNLDDFIVSDNIPNQLKKQLIDDFKYQPIFFHHGKDSEEFKMDDESRGTQRLFEIAPLFLIGMREGECIVIDELDNSLHPHISELLIKLINDPLVNTKNAQLIFTSHDMSLMDSSKMRRDQVCFTDKNDDGSTVLFAMDEIEGVRKDSPFAKWYQEGRLGAIPEINIKMLKQLLKEGADDE